jgi:hypothetical protein
VFVLGSTNPRSGVVLALEIRAAQREHHECSCVSVRHKLAEMWREASNPRKEHGEKAKTPEDRKPEGREKNLSRLPQRQVVLREAQVPVGRKDWEEECRG